MFHTNDSINVWIIKDSYVWGILYQLMVLLAFPSHPLDKVPKKLTKSYNSELRHLFQCCNFIPIKCLHKTPFQHIVRCVCMGGVRPTPFNPGLVVVRFRSCTVAREDIVDSCKKITSFLQGNCSRRRCFCLANFSTSIAFFFFEMAAVC